MTKLNELINKLEELFELDKTDLDFGIYRIVKQRQAKIKDFLNKKLPIKVQTILGKTNAEEQADELKKYKAECIRSFGENAFEENGQLTGMFSQTPAGKRYSEALEKSQNKNISTQLETEVYSHLLDFFSRYYQDGDFISQRRSAVKDKYAIPYNGEEVVMHWANKDQYYIKSSENLKDYVFTLKDKRIKFRLAGMDAVKDNNKAKRQMVLFKEADGKYDDEGTLNIEENGNNLIIPFYFKEVKKALTEKQHLISLENDISKLLTDNWQNILLANDANFTGKDSRTILKKHLLSYIRKQTSDFFIHKDLGKFLKNELDFFIKNEVMYLDDVINRPAEYLTSEIRKIKAIRTIAQQVIDFLAQFENFQKKLWLKKKFIYETNYCITLDRIPQEFYPEIAVNKKQIEEWIKLFAINDIEGDAIHISFEDFENGDIKTKIEFLKQNIFLILDTAFFQQNFKYKLLSKIDNLDDQTDGLLIHSENFQALNLLQTKYKEKVKCIYIDPPYNTNASEIAYKNGYKHSSWISLMSDRVDVSRGFLNEKGLFEIAIDDVEYSNLLQLCKHTFGEENEIGTITVVHNPRGRSDAHHLSPSHEYSILFAKNYESLQTNQLQQDKKALKKKYPLKDEVGFYRLLPLKRSGSNSTRLARPNLFYPIYYDTETKCIFQERENVKNLYKIFPIDGQGIERVWRWSSQKVFGNLYEIIVKENDGRFIIFAKDRIKVEMKPKTVWTDSKYDASSHGSMLLKKLFKLPQFDYPKSLHTVYDSLVIGANFSSTILDYFAGSGTTGHAVINLNREDGGKRKYILVEMGNYFNTVTKPRIQKVVYSKDWKNGKPTARETGYSHCFKYLRMESYEDTLNNLTLEDKHPDLLGLMLPENVKEDYLINYMLDIESRESLMDIDKFNDPFGYSLKIFNYETGEAEYKQVDLIETFNYILGVEVQEFRMKEGFITIEGKNNANETILIIWRNVEGKSNEDLREFISKTMRINTADTEFRAIYINGDHTLNDPHNKIFQIENVFQQLMFDVEEA